MYIFNFHLCLRSVSNDIICCILFCFTFFQAILRLLTYFTLWCSETKCKRKIDFLFYVHVYFNENVKNNKKNKW